MSNVMEMKRCPSSPRHQIVDFRCGANDFSRLMSGKLHETGKTCFFQNFDIIQTKYPFNFEKRDFMTVRREELLNGSKLIMGLNPPFGTKAALANKFVAKALEFNPKLIVLIVPKETKRLDIIGGYDLIWDDTELLAGKSFYIPGASHLEENELGQWNNNAPPLYLWSRPDFTEVHNMIAIQRGHVGKRIRADDIMTEQTGFPVVKPLLGGDVDSLTEQNGFAGIEPLGGMYLPTDGQSMPAYLSVQCPYPTFYPSAMPEFSYQNDQQINEGDQNLFPPSGSSGWLDE